MRLCRLAFLLAAVSSTAAGLRLPAQQPNPQVPEFTPEQRWGRLGGINTAWIEATYAIGKARGMTVDEIGTWLGERFADSWVGGLDARQFALSLRLNHLTHPSARVELAHFTDTLVIARFNTPVLGAFGADRWFNTMPLDDYNRVMMRLNQVIAERVGVLLEQRMEGGWMVVTIRNGYKVPATSALLRWQRAGFLFEAYVVEAIRMAKAGGKTATDAGRDAARAYAPGWSSVDTPWRYFRNWTTNYQSDPNYRCAVQSATPTLVKARCNRPWVSAVRDNLGFSKVTIEEYDAYLLAMEQGIADILGLTWDVQRDGEERVITVQRKR